MNLTEALGAIRALGQPVVGSADVVAVLGIGRDHASHIMSRLAATGHVSRIKRGAWVVSDNVDPMALASSLTAPFPAYVSLQTALYHHGMLSQVPAMIYCVSLARARVYRTPFGDFSVHHVAPGFFTGYRSIGGRGVSMATPEKALIDFLYLAPTRSRVFAALPELELPKGFSQKKAKAIINRIPSKARRRRVEQELGRILAGLESR